MKTVNNIRAHAKSRKIMNIVGFLRISHMSLYDNNVGQPEIYENAKIIIGEVAAADL